MKIALIGTRGVPANYGGFETCAEQVGARLAARGHEVTVYCRSHHSTYPGRSYRGMRLVRLPSIRNKYLDTLVHTFLSSLHALAQPYDVCLYFIVGNSPLSWIPRLTGKRTIINVDGLDWQRKKWPTLAKKYLRLCERLATFLPNALVTDSKVVQRYYKERYGFDALHIAYGSEVEPLPPGETLRRWGLEAGKYILFVGRLVPENCVQHLLEAYGMLRDKHGMKCVVVGDSAYAQEYVARLKASAPEGVVFTGYVFGDGYRELSANAYCFVETSEVGGTHPALLEAMGFGTCVVANDIPENVDIVGKVGFTYSGRAGASSLRDVLQQLLDNPGLVAERGRMAREYARERFSWEAVTGQYVALAESLLANKPARERIEIGTSLDSE